MNKKKQPKKKRLRLKLKPLITFFIFILVVVSFFNYFQNLPIKNIIIKGTTNISDISIIEATNIKDYPHIYSLSKKKMKEQIKTIPLVEDVSIKRNIFGKLTINIKEEKILFYYKYNQKFITNNGNSLENNTYYGYPTLVNFTPDTIFDELVSSFNKIDYNILKMINEIEYTPYKSAEGTIIDSKRFTIAMNDTNTVIIDTSNMKNLNKYMTILASPGMDVERGVIYLDTINDDRILFKSYENIAQESQAKEDKKEDQTNEVGE